MSIPNNLADSGIPRESTTHSHALSTAPSISTSPPEQLKANPLNSTSSASVPPVLPKSSSTPDGATNLKLVHTLILDASPLLLNQPSISTLLATAERLITSPSVLAEIRDPDARARVETTYLPFLEVQEPSQTSLTAVCGFAKKTGDFATLSKVDVEVLALAYGNEVERNGGDWRLRNNPGQKRLNGKAPEKEVSSSSDEVENGQKRTAENLAVDETEDLNAEITQTLKATSPQGIRVQNSESELLKAAPASNSLQTLSEANVEESHLESQNIREELDSGSDSDGWITPSNLRRRQAKDERVTLVSKSEPRTLQVATITSDFAMQNVLLQMNLNLLSPATCKRIQNIRTTVLRCHGCFTTCRDLGKQFCQRCGKPTLTRVSCTTNDKGEVKLHLKKNMQWNNRGNVYSVPKPASGSSNQKWKGPKSGGGKGGWGNNLILAPDQKEYERALAEEQRVKERNLMDADTLPGILTGERGSNRSRIKIGAGRNVNSRKR